MDFLDPRKKRARRSRLLIGYFLVSVAIILGTVILVYGAYGYGINTKTGDVVQNGLLFVDSKPGGAQIFLNDKSKNSSTSARLVLPAGEYKLTLKRDGYRSWERSFTLTEHAIARYVYPMLFPVEPATKTLKTYDQAPALVSQSPDRRWLLVQTAATATSAFNFDEYDTNDLTKPAKPLTVTSRLLSNASGQLKEVEWSSDNKNLLLEHTFDGGSEFIVYNRDVTAESFNVNKTLKINPTTVALRNKRILQLYLFDKTAGSLQVADTARSTVTPLLNHVLAFKPHGNNLISYITDDKAKTGEVIARIWDTDKSYPLYSFPAGDKYLVDAAQFQGNWYYAVGSDKAGRVNIYKNPLDSLQSTSIAKAVPMLSLRLAGAERIAFSGNTRIIGVQAGQSFAIYDLETQYSYHYTLDKPLAGPLHFMDGHRWIGSTGGTVYVSDYDFTNQQILVPTVLAEGGFFDRDFIHLLTVDKTADGTGFTLEGVDLRAGADLPKQ